LKERKWQIKIPIENGRPNFGNPETKVFEIFILEDIFNITLF